MNYKILANFCKVSRANCEHSLRSLTLTFWEWKCFEDFLWKSHWASDNAVCRTAQASPRLSITHWRRSASIFNSVIRLGEPSYCNVKFKHSILIKLNWKSKQGGPISHWGCPGRIWLGCIGMTLIMKCTVPSWFKMQSSTWLKLDYTWH